MSLDGAMLDENQTTDLGSDFTKSLTSRDFALKSQSPHFRSVFLVLYVAIIVMTLVGNLMVLVVIASNAKLRTVTNMFLASLAVSDLLIGVLNMPFQLRFHLEEQWTSGEIMCKLVNYIQGVVIVVSIMTLTGIAVDRYYAILHPLRARHVHTVTRALVLIGVFWVLSLVLMSPQIAIQRIEPVLDYSLDDANKPRLRVLHVCSEYIPDHRLNIAYTLFFYVAVYLLPVIIMFITYGRILHHLWTRPSIGESVGSSWEGCRRRVQEKKHIVRMLFVIVVLFAFGWFPFFTCQVYALFHVDHGNSYRMLLFFSQLLGYSNSCINPIIYCFLNDTFQQHLYRTVVQFRCCICLKSRRHQGRRRASSACTADSDRLNGIAMTSLTRHSSVDHYGNTIL